MKFFRGYRDIHLQEINHRLISQGYYGPAIYLALSLEGAQAYSSPWSSHSKIQVVGEYSLDETKLLPISNGEVLNLQKFSVDPYSQLDQELKLSSSFQEILQTKEASIAPAQLAQLALKQGFDGLLLTGKVEGGEQVVVPQNSSMAIKLTHLHLGVWIGNEAIALAFKEALLSLYNIPVLKQGGWYWFSYPQTLSPEMDKLMNFHSSLGHLSDVREVNYLTQTATFYEED